MKLFNWFSKNQNIQQTKESKEDTYLDIIVSLNKNYEIDFSVFLNDRIDDFSITSTEYAIVCSSFINAVMSNKLKKDTIEILDNQIKNSNNFQLIDNIISMIILSSEKNKNNNTFIKPSEVFVKNSI